ncbi:MAG: PA2779 family protein [Deltaproteobacteria bacterium]|nr:PA2779 family protein [Deltaproteobacteria bacterium]
MRSSRSWKELTAVVVIFSLLCLALPARPAAAGWIPSRVAAEAPHARLVSLLDREDVVRAFQTLGVDRAEAARRVAGLTDREASEAVGRLDSLPAGGDPVGTIVGAALLVFFVLLLTDLLGLTHFYPFTKRR